MLSRLLVLFAAMIALSGCETFGIERPPVESIADAIVVASADIETAAQQVGALCGQKFSGGECSSGALIDTATKDRLRQQLQQAIDVVKSANRLLAAGEAVEAESTLARADVILRAIQEEIERRQR